MGDNFSISLEYPASLASVSVGDVVGLNTAGTEYVTATAANIIAGCTPSAMAIGLGNESGYARLMHFGDVPASISGLAAGSISPIVLDTTTGKVKRKASGTIVTTDWFCGYADANGNIKFHKPFQFNADPTVYSRMPVVSVSGDYVASDLDKQLIIADTSGGPLTITMPTGVSGREVMVKDGANSASINAITLDGGLSEIENFIASDVFSTTVEIIVSSTSWSFIHDGTNWRLT